MAWYGSDFEFVIVDGKVELKMKKIKVEDYKKSNYSTLKMITGKVLPAGLVVATMITAAPNSTARQNGTRGFSLTEGAFPVSAISKPDDFFVTAGVPPLPEPEEILVVPGGLPLPEPEEPEETADIPVVLGELPFPEPEEPEEFFVTAGIMPLPEPEETEEKPVTVLINQTAVEFDVEPVLEDGRVLVPLRKIFETLNAYVTWDGPTKSATAVKGENTIVIAVDNKKMLKNGQEIILDVAAKIVGSRLLVPIRAVSEGLGCDVSWDKINKQVLIACNEDEDIYVLDGGIPAIIE